MKKTFKVVMLPTEKASPLFSYKERPDLLYYQPLREWTSIVNHLHLYIISDDEIKEGDWIYHNLDKAPIQWEEGNLDTSDPSTYGYKKIVATTDKSLNGKSDSGLQMCLCGTWQIGKDGYPACKGNCHTLDIPESFIQAYIKAYNEGKPITEVDLEVDCDHSKMPEKVIDVIKTRPDNTVIIHQSKMYSREEVMKFIKEYKERLTISRIKPVTESHYSKVNSKVADKWIQDNL